MRKSTFPKKDYTAIIITGMVLVAIIIIVLAVNPSSSTNKETITVEGVFQIEVIPDFVGVYFNIETIGDTSGEATQMNNNVYELFIASLEGVGIVKDEIKTQNFNVYKNYEWDRDKNVENGYKAFHSIKIKVENDDLSLLSDVIDAGVTAGANINSISFELTQETQNEQKILALELASKDAKEKAEAIARGFDKSIGSLVSVNVNEFGYYPWSVYAVEDGISSEAQADLARVAVSEIVPNERAINGRVVAVYKLE